MKTMLVIVIMMCIAGYAAWQRFPGWWKNTSVDVYNPDNSFRGRIELHCTDKTELWCESFDRNNRPMNFRRVDLKTGTAAVRIEEGARRAELIVTRGAPLSPVRSFAV